ncbi:phosphotransferase [Legionella erythra]|nr:phosphotransferase [Legionella erythra]
MMQTKSDAIQRVFNKKGITLKEPVKQAKQHTFDGGMTNQFLTVDALNGQRYLIRINGKLWPPFTREGEHHNLLQLKKMGVKTTLLSNNPEEGFQICRLQDEANRFTAIDQQAYRSKALYSLAKTMQGYHQLTNFKNHYSFPQTLSSASRRLNYGGGKEIQALHALVLRIFSLITQDVDNWVASHNDLLPSSIYLRNGQTIIVDWECSGKNHRSYDLAFFSLKSLLSPLEEAHLLKAYDPAGENNMEYWLPLMKVGVNYLLLLWAINSTRDESVQNALFLFKSLQSNLQTCFSHQSAKLLHAEKRFFLFKPHSPQLKKPEPDKSNQENVNSDLPSLASSS